MGQVDINATDQVSHIIVTYELFMLMLFSALVMAFYKLFTSISQYSVSDCHS